jgi:hypothetical protein
MIHDQLPTRPRRRLLAPLPLALVAVLVAAGGFIAGVLVQKDQQDSAAATGLPRGIANFAAGAATRAPAANGTAGEVKSVKGRTLYVTDAQGTTTAVRVGSAAKVTRTAESSANSIRPGDTVIVQGAKRANGSVQASSVTATAASSGASISSLFQGGSP